MGSRSVPGESSAEFAQALRALRDARLRPEVRLTEVPAPSRIAPHAVAMSADVVTAGIQQEGDELASGRLVLLYDPSAPEPWDGVWRLVTFARAELEPELANDPMLGAIGWSWLMEALGHHEATVRGRGRHCHSCRVRELRRDWRPAAPPWRWRSELPGRPPALTSVSTFRPGRSYCARSPGYHRCPKASWLYQGNAAEWRWVLPANRGRPGVNRLSM
jgi:hypothetical protein